MADWLGLVVIIGIFLTMAGFSCTIDLNKFLSYIKKPKGILIGLFCQYGLLPLSAYFISQILDLPSLHSIAFIITGSCPGGTLSNFWCWFFGSDLELSIAMTASSSILSFVFLTINCIIYMPLVSDENVKIDYASLAISVSSLICGVIFGLFIAHKLSPVSPIDTSSTPSSQSSSKSCFTNFLKKFKIQKILIIVGGLSMIITLLLGTYENTLVSSVPAYRLPFEIFIGGIILNLTSWAITFITSYFICQLPNNQSITVCIECANQNVGLSIAIILLTMDRGDADIAVGVPMFYGVLNAIIIFIFGSFFRVCGFIENKDDEFNHKYANSGFTKLCQFFDKYSHSKDEHIIDNNNNNNNNNNDKEQVTNTQRKKNSSNSHNSINIHSNPNTDTDIDIDTESLKNGSHRNLHSQSSTMTTLKSEVSPDTTPNNSNIEMLMEEYEMARTPSNEEVAVKQSLKHNQYNHYNSNSNQMLNIKRTLKTMENNQHEDAIMTTKPHTAGHRAAGGSISISSKNNDNHNLKEQLTDDTDINNDDLDAFKDILDQERYVD